MTTSSRKNCFHVLSGAGIALAMFLGAAPAVAADAADTSCRQEVRRVTVWPQGGSPKSAQSARVETREVTVCNGKVVTQKPERSASRSESETR